MLRIIQSLFGLKAGFTLACLLTATGATFCYLLSNFCGKSWISRQFSRQLTVLRRKVEDNRSSLIYYLLFLRLFPMTPNWFLNIASPIIGIPLHLFFISVFIGKNLSINFDKFDLFEFPRNASNSERFNDE
uniref:VTT domain-containing protein n=1 Tax=Tetranychus urticae TaxID=32264 RepID=T1KMR2_TETUR